MEIKKSFKSLFGDTPLKRLGMALVLLVVLVHLIILIILFPVQCFKECRIFSNYSQPISQTKIVFEKDPACFEDKKIDELISLIPTYLENVEEALKKDKVFVKYVAKKFWPTCISSHDMKEVFVNGELVLTNAGLKNILIPNEIEGEKKKRLDIIIDEVCTASLSLMSLYNDSADYYYSCSYDDTQTSCFQKLEKDIVAKYGNNEAFNKCDKIEFFSLINSRKMATISIKKDCINSVVLRTNTEMFKSFFRNMLKIADPDLKSKLASQSPICRVGVKFPFYNVDRMDTFFNNIAEDRLWCKFESCQKVCDFNNRLIEHLQRTAKEKTVRGMHIDKPLGIQQKTEDPVFRPENFITQPKPEQDISMSESNTQIDCSSATIEDCEKELINRWSEFTNYEYDKYNTCINPKLSSYTSYIDKQKFNPRIPPLDIGIEWLDDSKIGRKVNLISISLLILGLYLRLLHHYICSKVKKYIIDGDI